MPDSGDSIESCCKGLCSVRIHFIHTALFGTPMEKKYFIFINLCKNHRLDVKTFFTFFIIFIKKHVFYFLERLLFSSGKTFYPTKPAKILLNLLNFSIKRLLSDGFDMAVIKILL